VTDEGLSLATIKGGAIIELADDGIRRVLENVVDPNTKATAKRSVTVKLTFKPDSERDLMNVIASVQVGLAPAAEIQTKAWIAHTRNGVVAAEHDPRQPGLFDGDGETNDTSLRLAAVSGEDK
jgi:hypothetical protein